MDDLEISGRTHWDDWPQWSDDEFTGSDGETTPTNAGVSPQHGPSLPPFTGEQK